MLQEFEEVAELEEVPPIYADSEKVLEELYKIEERDGVLKPDAVVEFAKDETTELHKKFTWDDSEAGHQWRLFQARQLIRVVVTMVSTGKEKVTTKAFVHVQENSETERGYVRIARVLSSDELKTIMLNTAKKELAIFRKKYAELKELAEVFKAIDNI